MKIAIHRRIGKNIHTNSWSCAWEEYCIKHNLGYEFIDCLSPGALDTLRGFDMLLFHFGNYSYNDMKHARSVLYSAKQMGLKVFPDFADAWHFDDKIAQSFLLDSIGAPIPDYHAFFSKKEFLAWLDDRKSFPLVAKLKSGSGSHNVKMLKSRTEAKKYASIMFGKGFSPAPSLLFKASSNIRSAKSVSDFKRRFKRIPEFFMTLKRSSEFENERGYVYLQEYIQNEGYDLKISVVGDKVSYSARRVRPGDFRASGGGDLYYDKSHVPENVIKSSLRVAKALGVQCMGFDYVVDSETGEGLIVEMSYGFPHKTKIDAGGHWNSNAEWVEEPLNAPAEIIESMMVRGL